MIDRYLTHFVGNTNADLGEKVGNFGLGLLCVGFGKTYTVQKMYSESEKLRVRERVNSISEKVAAIALFIFALPVTLILTGAGLLGMALSKSHKEIFDNLNSVDIGSAHVRFGEVRVREFDENQPPEAVREQNSIVIRDKFSLTEDGTVRANRVRDVKFSKKSSMTINEVDIKPSSTNTAVHQLSQATASSLREQKRRFPPIGVMDTIYEENGQINSVHGCGELFSDEEIVEKCLIVKVHEIRTGEKIYNNAKLYVVFTRHDKAIIQQQAVRGCTAGAAAMLILDKRKIPNIIAMQTRSLAKFENQIRDLEEAGLKAVVKSASNLEELRGIISKGGSAIVSVSGKLGGHVIVVDDVSENLTKVRLRDPYHGWEITVTAEAFLKEWRGGDTIQAE